MTGEIQFMRKQIFGGFNRKDVVEYVAKIAKERNEAREAYSGASKKIEALEAEIEELKLELEKSRNVVNEISERKKIQINVEKLRSSIPEKESVDNQNISIIKKIKAKVTRKA